MKTCMDYRVDGRRPVGRPINTWLESIEADISMTERNGEGSYEEEV